MTFDVDEISVVRQNDGRVLVSAAGVGLRLSEDDCVKLALGLRAVAASDPPAVIVHMETGSKEAWVENGRR